MYTKQQTAEIAETLRKAGEWLDGHDWLRGHLTDIQERVFRTGSSLQDWFTGAQAGCARGAILVALGATDGRGWDHHPGFFAADSALQAYISEGDTLLDVGQWNNEHAADKAEVVKALYQAADNLIST